MDIFKICAVGIITAFCILVLKDSKSEAAMIVAIAGGCIVLLMLINYLTDIFMVIRDIANKASIPNSVLSLVIKIVGVGYITEFSAGIIEESGSKPLAEKIILGGRVVITVLALPIVVQLFNIISEILQ